MATISPIWKDYYVYFNTNESPVSYSIRINGEAIFTGKAWCPPSYNQSTFKTKINHICENYLYNEMPEFRNITEYSKGILHYDAIRTFQIFNDDKLQIIDEVTFVYDWSYDPTINYNNSSVMMSKPINSKGKEGMFFFRTSCDGRTVQTTISREPLYTYEIVPDCNSKWALYYLNRYGGWDSFLIEGHVTKKDGFNRNNISHQYDNNSLEFGTTPYMTEISSSYEIHTGWMNERESEILASNVFPSTRLYLHNLETDEVIPVIVNDADVLYKNRNNSGRKLLNYTINVVTSQKKHNKN